MANKSNKIGAKFENKLNKVFQKYRDEGKAYIIKVPVQWTVIRGTKGKIVKAFPRDKSDCLDYIGFLPNNKVIVFEAKSYDATGGKSIRPFPLSNIKEYQYDLVEELYKYIDNVFYIIEVRFEKHNEVYLVSATKVKEFKDNNERKSIPYNTLKEMGTLIKDLDILKYLEV